ncbi:hypothetical protein VTK26DRAFT_9187 [Humicola hyalothermophila]
MPRRLTDLPDDILFIVFANLESARDLRSLSLTCRALRDIVSHDGWKIFVKNRFPSLSVPAPTTGRHTWQQLAESLTWQSRCWDKRSLQFHALLPQPGNLGGARRQVTLRGLFLSVVDASFDPSTQQELVVWGAGEDMVARYRERQGRGQASKTSWHRLDGKDIGLSVGYDDITAIKIVKHRDGQAILAGRHNGQLSLLSAEPDRFGEQITQFGSTSDPGTDSRPSSEQESINSLDVLQNGNKNLLAVATKSTLNIYRLQEVGLSKTAPLTSYNLKDRVFFSPSARLGSAKWMENGESIALAVVGSKDPLHCLSLTPSGWVHHTAAKNARIAEEFNIKHDGTICPNSLEPVYFHQGAKRGTSLLLSAWRDGTIRLQDLRTPSPFDAVYQDNVDPWSNAEALMAYGTERFVAGGGEAPTVKVFDFRWPKNYYHTSGLPCLDRAPFPRPHQPFLKAPTRQLQGRAACDHVRQRPCHWHELSRLIYYRPNAKYFLSNSLRSFRNSSSVWSLARASDVAPNLYIGITGGVIEAGLEQCPEDDDAYATPSSLTPVVDPNFGFADWRAAAPPESGCKSRALVPSLMEIGDGYSFPGNDRSILLSNLLTYHGPRELAAGDKAGLRRHHRLDNGYQQEADFAPESKWAERFEQLTISSVRDDEGI